MKAPDKIYLSVGKGEDWAYAMWTQKNPEEQKFSELDEHEEYIRKDVVDETIKTAEDHAFFAGQEKLREKLLEWIDEYKNYYSGPSWDLLKTHIETL